MARKIIAEEWRVIDDAIALADNKFIGTDGNPLRIRCVTAIYDNNYDIGDEIEIPKTYTVYYDKIKGAFLIANVKSKDGKERKVRFFPNSLANSITPIDENGRRMPKIGTTGPVAEWYLEQGTIDNAMKVLAGKSIIVVDKKVHTIKDYSTKELRTIGNYTYDWKIIKDDQVSKNASSTITLEEKLRTKEKDLMCIDNRTEMKSLENSNSRINKLQNKSEKGNAKKKNVNKEIDKIMHSIISSTYEIEDNFSGKLDYFRHNPFKARMMFCEFSTMESSKKCFKNQILIRKIYDSIVDKYCIDYYDVVCICLLNIAINNEDFWSVVRLCEEIIEFTKDEKLCSTMLELRKSSQQMANTRNLNGYTSDALKYFTNPNAFETFWIMCNKRCSNLSIDVESASLQKLRVKIDANGSFTGCANLGEFSVGYLDGTIWMDFYDIEEYCNRKYKKMNHADYPRVRIYEENDMLVFEAYDFFYKDYFLRIISKKVTVSKELHTPLFR